MVAGLNFIRNLGLSEYELLPVRTEIKAANKTEIKVIGAVFVELQLNTPSSHLISKQVVYITSSTRKVFLDREAFEHLGLIKSNFPGEVLCIGEIGALV